MAQCAALVAIEWSETKPDVGLLDVATGQTEAGLLTHPPEALEAWATALRTRFAGQPIAVCLEQSRGPLFDALLPYALLVLSPIHPATLAQDREACSPSRAKEEPQDADDLLALLLHPRERLKAWRPAHAKTRTLQSRGEHRRRLGKARTRISKRLTALLQADVPQVLQGFDDIRTTRVCACWRRWPTLEAGQQVRPATRETFFRAHTSVRQETLAHRIAAITAAVPWTTDPAVRHSSVLMLKARATQRQPTMEAIRALDSASEPLGRLHEDYPLLAPRPGAGPVYAARLTAAMGTARHRGTTGEA